MKEGALNLTHRERERERENFVYLEKVRLYIRTNLPHIQLRSIFLFKISISIFLSLI